MNNTIRLTSVSQLMEQHFYIPSYQRGYRWNKQQVVDLLEDIYEFARKRNKAPNEFYCLQPIVVRSHKWKNEEDGPEISGWELVDGQQRLTTIRIILSYLVKAELKGESLKSEYGKDVFTLEYQTRPVTEKFLNDIVEGNDENIDYYHIASAYMYIREWFEKRVKPKEARENIIKTLILDPEDDNPQGTVQVIWYEIADGTSPIDTFIRINMGKISLTDAELIKALFLQQRNFGARNELSRLRQLEIASEWDRVENQLQDDNFWWFLNRGKNEKPARIEFIFDLMCSLAMQKDEELEEQISGEYATFRYFYRLLQQADGADFIKDRWDEVMDYFRIFNEWYEHPIWYHYAGFLIHAGTSLTELIAMTTSEDQNKDEITKVLKEAIYDRNKNIRWLKEEDGTPFLDLSYKSDHKKVKEILLLFNLEYVVKQWKNDDVLFYKFPFKSFKEEKWDVEHIDSNTENPLTDRSVQKEWLLTAKADLPELNHHAELNLRIANFVDKENSREAFDQLYKEVLSVAGDTVNDEKLKNNIGNLTLLDQKTNRGYGNSLFTSKRKAIISKDSEGAFIPVCTKNVFLKYFDISGNSRTKWNAEDIKTYRNVLSGTLRDFLPKAPQKNVANE